MESSTAPPTPGTEGIYYWILMDIDKMITNNEPPYTEPTWIRKELEKDDRVWCKCQVDKYYYDATVKTTTGHGERKKFKITFAGLKACHDQTFDFTNACASFLPVNLQTARFVKAYNAKRLEGIREKVAAGGAIFEEKYDRNGGIFIRKFGEKDRGMIAKGYRIRYPPRRSIAELIDCFKKDRTAFLRVHPFTSDDFLAGLQTKFYENNFNNSLFYNEPEINDAIEYCARIKHDRGIDDANIDLSYSFGIIHLLRYLSYLYESLRGGEASEQNKKLFYLVHELAQFAASSNGVFYGTDDYIRD